MKFFPKYWMIALVVASAAQAADDSLLLSGFEPTLASEWRHTARAKIVPFVVETASDKVKVGQSSGRWENLDHNKWATLANCPGDWIPYASLSLWVHSAVANGQQLNFSVSAPHEQGGQGYYLHQITVDWTGWKQVVVPLSSFRPNRTPAPWSRITGFQLSSGGWGAKPLADTVLHLDDLRLIRR